MKRLLLIAGLVVTLLNGTFGIVYACTCVGAGGGSCCGTTCTLTRDGNCICSGTCGG